VAIKCPKCHSENPEDTFYCGKCATPLPSSREIDITQTKTLETPSEELTTGSTFAGRYQIIEELGHGGMGRIYRAVDKKLNEEVALKMIRPEIASEKRTLERFHNELKLARKISHPNVGRMYELLVEEGVHFITMEYVSGEDLKSSIRRFGQLPISKSISIAKQICEGLAEAHKIGVVHRDLKPSNIMVDKEGNAKVMDFGIARSLKTKGITGEGVSVGTPEYMSPEQVEGKEADQRADIYSLGIILYEMVTGRVPFEADTGFAVALKHKSEQPENPKRLNPQIPDQLSRLILKCLEKDREKRYQGAGEVLTELTMIEQGLPSTEKVVPKRKLITPKEISIKFSLRKLFIPALGLVAVAAVIALLIFLIKSQPSKQPIIPSHKQLTFTGDASWPAISPDGEFIAYVTGPPDKQRVMVQDIGGGQAIEISQGEWFQYLQWLPDSSALSFYAYGTEYGSDIFMVPRLGGAHRKLLSVPGQNPPFALSPDGSQIVYYDLNKKHFNITDVSTGKTTPIFLKESFPHVGELDWSPDGNLLLFLARDEKRRSAIQIIKIDGGEQSKIVEDEAWLNCPQWSPKGDAIYYLRQGELWKIPFSSEEGRATKPASPVLGGLQAGSDFTITRDGRQMVYTRAIYYSNLWQAEVKGTGKNQVVTTTQITRGSYYDDDARISPDGSLVAFRRVAGATSNIYVVPIEGGAPRQITFLDSKSWYPAWSPDGKEIAFGSIYGGSPKVWKISAQGGTPYQFSKSRLNSGYGEIAWAPGPNIIYETSSEIKQFNILNPVTEEENLLVKAEYGQVNIPRYSPDGKKIAVFGDFPPRGLWIISLEDSSRVLLKEELREEDLRPLEWTSDGKWIYALQELSGKIEMLMISLDGTQVKSLLTEPYFQEQYNIFALVYSMAITPNGNHFVYPISKSHSDVWLVDNFDKELK
jgi:serine/threonine-protein kinase